MDIFNYHLPKLAASEMTGLALGANRSKQFSQHRHRLYPLQEKHTIMPMVTLSSNSAEFEKK